MQKTAGRASEMDSPLIELKEKIENSSKKLVYMKYRNFLDKFGMKSRNSQKLELIYDLLDKHGIGAYAYFDEGWTLEELPLDETIRFRFKDYQGETEMKDSETVEYEHEGKVTVADGDSPKVLYPHQEDAIKSLNKSIQDNKSFAGLLVIPTGGGKTLTAVYYLLKNYIDNNKKILWIAHRYELLEQALKTFKDNSYSNILKRNKTFSYRIISGMHDRPVNIKNNDDIIIASKDSLKFRPYYLIDKWIAHNKEDIFFVIDEAHHAVAKTYRKIIETIKENVKTFRMIGLTATPYRTAENEQGYLKKIFSDDIVYKIDLRTLINYGILAEPIFEYQKTGFDMTKELSKDQLHKIKNFDFESIGGATAKTIGENAIRNNRIVDHYVKNLGKYGQTIVFALNIDNAIALNKLFQDKNILSDYVVSTIRDKDTLVNISPKENKEKIDKFKKGELQILINVNILTEGIDIPGAQTAFLTRPTISKILMMQMVGRVLRGKKAGGKEKANIVYFLDDWKENDIIWVNPKELFEDDISIVDKDSRYEKKIIRFVSIQKIEEFASILDGSIDTRDLENLDFIQRIPIGIYSYTVYKKDDVDFEKPSGILVYDNLKQSYEDFVNDLPEIFKGNNISSEKEYLEDEELDKLAKEIEKEYFYGCEKFPQLRLEDIKLLLQYYCKTGIKPSFIPLKDREKYDVSKVAQEIYDKSLGGKARAEFETKVWEENKEKWGEFFGFNFKYFAREISIRYENISHPDNFIKSNTKPRDEKGLRELEKLSMQELKETKPEYWKKLTDEVYQRSKDKKGNITCAESGFKSEYKRYFHIDHIIPISKGGLTVIDNLQVLKIKENLIKSNKLRQ